METKIQRKYKTFNITPATSVASATTLRWDDVAGGCLFMGTVATSATSLQVWGSGTEDGTFGRLHDSSGQPADITLSPSLVDARVYAIPDAAYGCGAIKIVAGQAAATAASCLVMLKT